MIVEWPGSCLKSQGPVTLIHFISLQMFVLLPRKIKNKKFLCLAQELLSLLAICIRLNVTRIFQHMWVNIYTHFKQKFQIPCCFSEEPNLVVKVMNRTFSFSLNEKGVFKDCFLQGALFFSFNSLWVEMLEGRAGWLPQNSLPSLFKLLLLGPWEPVDNSSMITESKSIKQRKGKNSRRCTRNKDLLKWCLTLWPWNARSREELSNLKGSEKPLVFVGYLNQYIKLQQLKKLHVLDTEHRNVKLKLKMNLLPSF